MNICTALHRLNVRSQTPMGLHSCNQHLPPPCAREAIRKNFLRAPAASKSNAHIGHAGGPQERKAFASWRTSPSPLVSGFKRRSHHHGLSLRRSGGGCRHRPPRPAPRQVRDARARGFVLVSRDMEVCVTNTTFFTRLRCRGLPGQRASPSRASQPRLTTQGAKCRVVGLYCPEWLGVR